MTRRIIIRTQKVNGFIVQTGRRRLRKVHDYKDRKEKPFKTKTGAIWKEGRYFKTGAHDGPVHGTKKGFVEYEYFKRRWCSREGYLTI